MADVIDYGSGGYDDDEERRLAAIRRAIVVSQRETPGTLPGETPGASSANVVLGIRPEAGVEPVGLPPDVNEMRSLRGDMGPLVAQRGDLQTESAPGMGPIQRALGPIGPSQPQLPSTMQVGTPIAQGPREPVERPEPFERPEPVGQPGVVERPEPARPALPIFTAEQVAQMTKGLKPLAPSRVAPAAPPSVVKPPSAVAPAAQPSPGVAPSSPYRPPIAQDVPAPPSAPIPNRGGAYAGQGDGSLAALTQSITTQIQNMASGVASSAAPDVTAVFMRQAQAILGMLDEEEKKLRAENAASGSEIDPSTKFTIDRLRETLEENLKSTRENLNRRGLYDSGILLELETKLQKGSASDEARLLAERLSKLQEDLRTGLSSIRGQRVSTLGQFGYGAAQAAAEEDRFGRKMGFDREQSAIQAMLNLRGQVGEDVRQERGFDFTSGENALGRAAEASRQQAGFDFTRGESALGREFQGEQGAAQRALEQQRLGEQQRQYDETFGAEKAKFNIEQQFRDRQLAQQAADAAAGRATQGQITPYQAEQIRLEQERNNISRQNAAQGGYSGGISKANTDAAAQQSLKFEWREDAQAWFDSQKTTMQRSGVDLQTVQDFINQNIPSRAGRWGPR